MGKLSGFDHPQKAIKKVQFKDGIEVLDTVQLAA